MYQTSVEYEEIEYRHKCIKEKDWVKGTAEISPSLFSVTAYEVLGILQHYCFRKIRNVVIQKGNTRNGKGTDR